MSHTNHTQHYELPQYIGSDIINPLVDTNDAYNKIDTALKNIADGVVSDGARLDTLESAVGNIDNGLVKDVADLKSQNGDNVLTTSAKTLSGAVNELDADIANTNVALGTAQGNITALQNKVGSDTLNTDAQNLSGAVNELLGKLHKVLYTYTGDGTKTMKEVLTLFYATLNALSDEELASLRIENRNTSTHTVACFTFNAKQVRSENGFHYYFSRNSGATLELCDITNDNTASYFRSYFTTYPANTADALNGYYSDYNGTISSASTWELISD